VNRTQYDEILRFNRPGL